MNARSSLALVLQSLASKKMAGLAVGGMFFAFDSEKIDIIISNSSRQYTQADQRLLESFQQGEFWKLRILDLVIAFIAVFVFRRCSGRVGPGRGLNACQTHEMHGFWL